MSAAEQQRRPVDGHSAVAMGWLARLLASTTVGQAESHRPWAVHGPTERANVVVTTHRQPEAVFAIARIGG